MFQGSFKQKVQVQFIHSDKIIEHIKNINKTMHLLKNIILINKNRYKLYMYDFNRERQNA